MIRALALSVLTLAVIVSGLQNQHGVYDTQGVVCLVSVVSLSIYVAFIAAHEV